MGAGSEGLVCVGGGGFTVDPAVVLEGGDNLVDGTSPGLAISTNSRSMVVVDVTGVAGFLQAVFAALPWSPNVTAVRRQFSIQHDLGLRSRW